MKFFTRNHLYYTLAFALLTIVAKWLISAIMNGGPSAIPWVVAVAYGVAAFCLGLLFGRQDRRTLPLYDAGFRYHLATYIIYVAVFESWYFLGFMAKYENIGIYRFLEGVWAVFVVANFVAFLIARRRTIKGIEKSEIFD